MNIVPIYGLAMISDALLFNTIEFWTGSNPIAMGAGEEVIKYASQDGKDFKITIRQNEVIVEDLTNPGQELDLSFKPMEQSWYLQTEAGAFKIATVKDGEADFFLPSGKSYTLKEAM